MTGSTILMDYSQWSILLIKFLQKAFIHIIAAKSALYRDPKLYKQQQSCY